MQFKPVTLFMGQQLDINQTLPVDQLLMTQYFLKQGYNSAANPDIKNQPYNPYEHILNPGPYGIKNVLAGGLEPNKVAVYTHKQLTGTLGFADSNDLGVENNDPALDILHNSIPVFPNPEQNGVTAPEQNGVTAPVHNAKLNLISELLWDNQYGDNTLHHGYVLAFTVAGQSDKKIYYLDQNDQWKALDLSDAYNTENPEKIRQTAKFHLYYYASVAVLGNTNHLSYEPVSETQSKIIVFNHTNNITVNNNVWDLDFNGNPNVNLDLTGQKLVFHLLPFVFKPNEPVAPILFQDNNQNFIFDYQTNREHLIFTDPVLNFGILTNPKRSHVYMVQRFNPNSNYLGDKRIWGFVNLTENETRQIAMFNMAMIE